MSMLLGFEGEARKHFNFQVYSSFPPNSLRFTLLGMPPKFVFEYHDTLLQVSELKSTMLFVKAPITD